MGHIKMAKLYYKSDLINESVLQNVIDAKNHLNVSYSKANALSVPNDFSYRSFIINLPNELKKLEDSCENVKTWLNKSVQAIDMASSEVETKFNGIEVEEIPLRSESIISK